MYEVAIFNPPTGPGRAMSEDVSTIRVEEFTVEAIFAELKAQHWHFGDGGVFAAVKAGGGNDSMLLFEVD